MTENIINGILAYGSLISDPGKEIEQAMSDHGDDPVDVLTPFRVEFARKSSKRGKAPTLVPFASGKRVKGKVLAVNLPEVSGANILYRREMNEVGTTLVYEGGPISYYDADSDMQKIYDASPTENIIGLKNFEGFSKVLFARFHPNIEKPNAKELARLAIDSVANLNYKKGRDGISYLILVKQNGIITGLSPDYEKEILRKKESCCLEQALERIINEKGTSGA